MRLLIFTLILSIFSSSAFAQLPDFFREYITVEISEGMVEVTGVYQFRNIENRKIEMNLFYPFPQDPDYSAGENLFAFEVVNDSTINRLVKDSDKGGQVRLEMEPSTEKTLYIGYSQKLYGDKAEYILTTTKNWGKPLESSIIELIVPNYLEITELSYLPIDTINFKKKTHFIIRKTNFMPMENFIVWFKDKE